jgi:4-carboxymuconolactone decarboxylase
MAGLETETVEGCFSRYWGMVAFHLKRAREKGITREEIIATITHLAFYAGWLTAMSALQISRKVFEEAEASGS